MSKYRIIQLDSPGTWGNIISDEVLEFDTDDEAIKYAYDSRLHWRNAVEVQCAEPWDEALLKKIYHMKSNGMIKTIYHTAEEINIWNTDWEYEDPICILSNKHLNEYIQNRMKMEIIYWKDLFSEEEIKSWFEGAKFFS